MVQIPKKIDSARRLFKFVLIFFSLLTLAIVIANHYLFRTYAFDYGVYNFAFCDFAHIRISPCPIYLSGYDITFLQDHFSLTLILLSPLYWLLSFISGTYTLLIVQSAFITYGGWATYKFIELKSNNYKIAILALIFYFILLGRFTALRADCNLAIIGSAVVPVFLYYFEKKKFIFAGFCFLFLLINREDYSLWLIFISLFLIINYRKDEAQLKFSVVLLIATILAFICIFNIIIPGLEDENKKYNLFAFSALGQTPYQAFSFIFHNPLKAFELLFTNPTGNSYLNGVKEQFYVVYFISGGFLLLYRPLYLVPFLPLIAKKMYSDDAVRWSIESYYCVEFVSILPLMVFLIILQLKQEKIKLFVALLVCLCTLIVTVKEIIKPNNKHLANLGSTEKYNFFNKSFYTFDGNVSEINQALEMIPEDAIVSASGKLTPHLAFRKKIYYYPNVRDAEYVCLFKRGDYWPATKEDFEKKTNELIASGCKILVDKNNFLLLKIK